MNDEEIKDIIWKSSKPAKEYPKDWIVIPALEVVELLEGLRNNQYADKGELHSDQMCKCGHEGQWHDFSEGGECRVDTVDDPDIKCNCKKFEILAIPVLGGKDG